MTAAVTLQCGEYLGIGAGDGDEGHDFVGLLGGQTNLLTNQQSLDLLSADLIQLIHGTHNVTGTLGEAQHGIEAIEDLTVIHTDLEALQAQGGECLVDDGGDFCLVGDVQLAITNHVDVSLIKLTEASALGAFAAVDLSDLEAAEGEGQVAVVQGHVLGQRYGQVKTQGQVGITLGEAINLLLGITAALGQQNLRGLNDGGVQAGKAVEGVGLLQGVHHAVELSLAGGKQFHKAGESAGLNLAHIGNSF